MSGLPEPKPIREIGGIDRAAFEAEVRPARQPVVIRGLARDWPAVEAGRASPAAAIAYLKRFSHRQPVPAILGAPEIEGRFFYTPDLTALNFQRGQTPLDPFLDRLLRDQGAERPFAMAVQSIPLPELLPGFVDENAIDLLDASIVPRIWLGNEIRVATHYDLMENIGIVVAGRRRFTVFPPEQIANLYTGPFELTPAGTPVSLVDLAAPDLGRFPRFAAAAATAQSAVLEPGDAIYLPFHWWHGVDSLEPVNAFVNYWWNPAPAGLGNPYDALMLALMALRALPDDQRGVWRMLLDHYVFGANGDPVEHLPDAAKGVLGPVTPQLAARMRATLIDALQRQ
ncbi:cupin-like domain-containing protein [Sphingomonas crusticola]|uniref:cupin-like domain-containing protein n=1 Tax=Sphingomonas crusticola TaxID=1697973 RepID=UPI000E249512|nr:cupin-like domain-containing protein [Sphingomonas crusticola]